MAMGSDSILSVYWKPIAYGALNIASASGIVFANKLVLSTFGFSFTCTLTWVHTMFTLVGMRLFLLAGMFQHKKLQQMQLLPLAAAYVGYIVLCNLSLKINTVGFYQVMKIAVAPTVMALELLFFKVIPPGRIIASVVLVCLGIAIATVTDSKLISNVYGLAVGFAATLVTALYQIWVGSKQKELQASSMQLLHQYTPQAALILGLLIPIMEPVGKIGSTDPHTLLGYQYTPAAVAAIVLSAVLGLLVSLSTFLVIGCTSSLTYNVVGHLKTVIILSGGCLLFGDEMPPKKLLGVAVAMAGIVWYTHLKMQPAAGPMKVVETKANVSDGGVAIKADAENPASNEDNSAGAGSGASTGTATARAAALLKGSYHNPNGSAFMPFLPGVVVQRAHP